jgi:hypothetical protein
VILSAWNRQWAGARLDAVEVLSKPVDLNRLLKSACDRAPSIRSAARRADVKGLQLGVINRAQNNRGILKVLPLMNAHF